MTCVYYILAPLAAFLVLIFARAPMRAVGSRMPFDRIGHLIGMALRGGDFGTVLVLKHIGSKRRIRFLNTMAPAREKGLRMVLREKHCCGSEFADAQCLLGQGGHQFQIRVVGARKELAVDFGQDVEQACKVAELVILRVFGLDESAQFRPKWRGPLDTLKAQCEVGPGDGGGGVSVEHRGTSGDLHGRDDDAGGHVSACASSAEDGAFAFETDVEIDEDAY
ncbi:hypothetical protein LCGC14_2131250, partial [marine sediment metagenome]